MGGDGLDGVWVELCLMEWYVEVWINEEKSFKVLCINVCSCIRDAIKSSFYQAQAQAQA